ncbi:MAG: HisA/HisF-related TIM barrel protein [Thermoproteota archaeon]
MMGYSDGQFCAMRGKGCAMVQLGAYLAEPPAYGKVDCALPPNRKECVQFLEKEFDEVKRSLDTIVCVNIATPKLEWGLQAMEFVSEAGGIFELNIHGGYEPYLKQGKIRAMVLPGNREELFEWFDAFSDLRTPMIVKFREGVIDDYTPILERVEHLNFLVHFNIRDERTRRPDFDFVKEIKNKYSFFLLVSGYVRSSEDARILFDAGADMVGVAEPTIQDPEFVKKIFEGM